MKKNNSFRYPKTQRESVNGKRHYVFDKEKLPSVTTILDITQPAEKRESLAAWRLRVGEDSAARIMEESAARGNTDGVVYSVMPFTSVVYYFLMPTLS